MRLREDLREGAGTEVRAVVAGDLVDSHVVGSEPPLGAPPESDEGGGGLVVVGLDVGDLIMHRVRINCAGRNVTTSRFVAAEPCLQRGSKSRGGATTDVES